MKVVRSVLLPSTFNIPIHSQGTVRKQLLFVLQNHKYQFFIQAKIALLFCTVIQTHQYFCAIQHKPQTHHLENIKLEKFKCVLKIHVLTVSNSNFVYIQKVCSRSLYCLVLFPVSSTDCCDFSITWNFSNFIFSKWDIWSCCRIELRYWYPILMLSYVVWPLLGETIGSCVTHWLIPCDHSLPHMGRLVTASCQNQISAWVETNRVDRTWMSLVLQQTPACLNAPDACSVVCR